ncbi:hypothetical protein EF096_15810 [Pseudomonas neustonica]|uniref:Uncharacterized protein n=1 Tax=Pseudomonas neustonica TaxID=2487346 RepID=A0ABX9XEQ9_9PSED|nr:MULTISPECIES: hypothetical protein [Pseudomonas]ROZ80926.1 hypothetical protein EF099_16275 [Pseudomonas sp. SSM44]ROZ82124.1 hypothetical protein EF096_15810 [Pseudomonas neustonica]
MKAIHENDYTAIGNQHEHVTSRINDMLIELQNHAYQTGVERGKELAKQAAAEAGTISPTLCQTIHLGQPGVIIEAGAMIGPDDEEVATLTFSRFAGAVRLTFPTQTQALAVLAAATAEDCTEAGAQPVACECGDSYPPGSYGAGFITQLLAMVQVRILEAMSHACSPKPAAPADYDPERENAAFESYVASLSGTAKKSLSKDDIGLYLDSWVGPAHDGWQARARIGQAPAAQDVAGLVEALGRALDFIRGDGDFEHREALERCECYACVTGEIIDSLAAHQSGGAA